MPSLHTPSGNGMEKETPPVIESEDGTPPKAPKYTAQQLLDMAMEQAMLLESGKIGTWQALFEIVREYKKAVILS
jgi:hypothetical protein